MFIFSLNSTLFSLFFRLFFEPNVVCYGPREPPPAAGKELGVVGVHEIGGHPIAVAQFGHVLQPLLEAK